MLVARPTHAAAPARFSLHKTCRFQYYDMNKWQHAMSSVLLDSESDYRRSVQESGLEVFKTQRDGTELTLGGIVQAYVADGNLAEDLISLGIGGVGSVARGVAEATIRVNGLRATDAEEAFVEGRGTDTARKIAAHHAAFMNDSSKDSVYASMVDMYAQKGDAPNWLRHPGGLIDGIRTLRTAITGGGGILDKLKREKARLAEIPDNEPDALRYASACSDAIDA